MKALLLRVGIDTGCGGVLAPIFENGSFEYIPIPESRETEEKRTYADLPARNSNLFSEFLPSKLRHVVPHMDPEFSTFTYGDPTRNKRLQLLKLASGDLLIFYAGLEPIDKRDKARLFLIGHFAVKKVHDFKLRKNEKKNVPAEIKENAHAKRVDVNEDAVIVEGDKERSELYQKAIPLGDSGHRLLPDLAGIAGREYSILRAIGHWIDQEHVHRFREYLHHGVPALVNESTNLFSYVLDTDAGFAPNPNGGYCTLACCKPKIRAVAKAGDWVMGTLPKRFGANKLAYAMRINETLSFDKYFNDERFQNKKPGADPDGDNIYCKRNGKFEQLENRYHGPGDLGHDTQADCMLIGSLFWYFGGNAPEIPPEFSSLIKTGPGNKRINHTACITGFVRWLSLHYRPGLHGKPRDRSHLDTGNATAPSPKGCSQAVPPIRATLYTKRDCPLCDKAKAVLAEFKKAYPLRIEEVDIERDAALFREYGEQIPVVFLENRKAFKFRIEPEKLREKLERLLRRKA